MDKKEAQRRFDHICSMTNDTEKMFMSGCLIAQLILEMPEPATGDRADDAMLCPHVGADLEAQETIATLREQLAAREAAAAFGRAVFDDFWNEGDPGDLDGGQLQELAATYGMLSKHPVPEGGCGECCNCVGSGADTGDDCFRPTEAAIARQEGGANG